MAVSGLNFRTLSTLDICLRTGQNLHERYKGARDAGRDVDDLFIRVERVWIHIAYQLGTVRSSKEEVPPVLSDYIGDLLDKLQFILHTAYRNIEKATDNNGVRKVLMFALAIKSSLDKDVSALEKWKDVFDPTFYMLSIPRNPRLDRILSIEARRNVQPDGSAVANVSAIRDALAGEPTKQFSSVWLDPLRMHSPDPIGYSEAHIVLDENTHTKYIMDTITVDPDRKDYGQLDKDVTKLARVLRESKDVPGILTCKGVVRKRGVNGQPEEFQFILEMPRRLGDTPSCLRSVLHRSTHDPPPRDDRVHLAKQIANAVIFVHSLHFVHKNMRPETILIFPNHRSKIGVPFLVGFQMFRSAEGITLGTGDSLWSKNIYRHPGRQGIHPDNIYRMQHDIYSLGVILLEIGLWSPFVDQNGLPGVAISQIVPILQGKNQKKGAAEVKRALITMAHRHLPQGMGAKYADMVVACLTCLDSDSELGSEAEFFEDDGILVGVRYIQRILSVLEEIEG
ncbi:hypothetical protein B9Z19DRAFT_1028497 [Tuber borchii]|uniref:Protein kinase domain-containing protein n=1 Tax=Tuber borchii TaxID=42251 RepID=A0A2T6ZM76_TUBBO|nr:hypothetical protein B9Z19DRAFT_1028497 [Tuber borchii]